MDILGLLTGTVARLTRIFNQEYLLESIGYKPKKEVVS